MTKKILVADDNNFIRTLVKATLEPMGFELMEAVDGEDAVRSARLHSPDLILLDVVMPGKDGFTALAEIRESIPPADCAIVMLTTSATDADMQRSKDAGADDYIVKPFEKSDLRATVRALLAD